MDYSSSCPQRQHRASAMDMDAPAPFMDLEQSLAFPGFPTSRAADKVRPPGKGWARIACSSKKAHGCGSHGEALLEGITLYVRTDHPYLTTTLSVFLNDDARRSVEAELKVSGPDVSVAAEGAVKVASADQDQLLVLLVAFSCPTHNRRMYYLVHDATDASLYMVPFLPRPHIVCAYTTTAVPRFTGAGGGRDHELVLLGRKFCSMNLVLGGLVCVCSSSPAATRAANEGAADNKFFESVSTGPWQVKPRLFPDPPYAFEPQEVFCFQGKLYWADFAQGLVYCDLHAEDGDPSFVKFEFISLPSGYLVHGLTESQAKRRSIGCIGSSIYFVYIDNDHRRPGDEIVKVWTLDKDRQTWKRHRGFPCPWREMWRQVYFMDAGAGARDLEPQYPVLMPGGALCLYLHQDRRNTRESDYICSFDMHTKRPLWFGPVHDHQSASFILPTDFFTGNNTPTLSNNDRARKRGSANKQDECAKTCKPRHYHDPELS